MAGREILKNRERLEDLAHPVAVAQEVDAMLLRVEWPAQRAGLAPRRVKVVALASKPRQMQDAPVWVGAEADFHKQVQMLPLVRAEKEATDFSYRLAHSCLLL
jgi:hypothetical protein